jgi:hypothetical protein
MGRGTPVAQGRVAIPRREVPVKKKLLLSKESLRSLTHDDLADAGGAGPGNTIVIVQSQTCRCPIVTTTILTSSKVTTSMPTSSVASSYEGGSY